MAVHGRTLYRNTKVRVHTQLTATPTSPIQWNITEEYKPSGRVSETYPSVNVNRYNWEGFLSGNNDEFLIF